MKKIFVFLLPFLLMSFSMVKLTAQNVGIGTTTPNLSAMLHVDLGNSLSSGLLVSGNYNFSGSVPDLGPGSRMMFYPGKSAFRAGIVYGTQWDNINVGRFSAAFGFDTKAVGEASFASGTFANAFGYGSLSIGYQTMASGDFSVALGYGAKVFGNFATAMGPFSSAIGMGSFATGRFTAASGNYSTSMGYQTTARSFASVVIGQFNDSISSSNPIDWVSTNPLLILGNGGSNTSRSNALVVYKNGNMDISGFTQLGKASELAPAIKMKEFYAYTATMENAWTDVSLNLNMAKILSVSILLDAGPAFNVQVPPSYRYYAGYEYDYHISPTNIVIINSATNSFNILSKPIRILVTYKQ